jgi:cytochrome c
MRAHAVIWLSVALVWPVQQVAAQPITRQVQGGDPEAGRAVIARYGCGVCHLVPGVSGARGTVGPSLAGFGDRNVIGGIVPNTPDWLVRWISNPPAIAPATMMPAMGLSDEETAHAAAYLLSLRAD